MHLSNGSECVLRATSSYIQNKTDHFTSQNLFFLCVLQPLNITESFFHSQQLKPRFDIIAFAQEYGTSTFSYDQVVMNFTLSSELTGCILAIVDKRKLNKLSKGRYDISDMAVQKPHARLPKEHFVMLTDCPELAAVLMEDDEFVRVLWASVGLEEGMTGRGIREPLIESIVLTDQGLKTLPDTYVKTRRSIIY